MGQGRVRCAFVRADRRAWMGYCNRRSSWMRAMVGGSMSMGYEV